MDPISRAEWDQLVEDRNACQKGFIHLKQRLDETQGAYHEQKALVTQTQQDIQQARQEYKDSKRKEVEWQHKYEKAEADMKAAEQIKQQLTREYDDLRTNHHQLSLKLERSKSDAREFEKQARLVEDCRLQATTCGHELARAVENAKLHHVKMIEMQAQLDMAHLQKKQWQEEKERMIETHENQHKHMAVLKTQMETDRRELQAQAERLKTLEETAQRCAHGHISVHQAIKDIHLALGLPMNHDHEHQTFAETMTRLQKLGHEWRESVRSNALKQQKIDQLEQNQHIMVEAAKVDLSTHQNELKQTQDQLAYMTKMLRQLQHQVSHRIRETEAHPMDTEEQKLKRWLTQFQESLDAWQERHSMIKSSAADCQAKLVMLEREAQRHQEHIAELTQERTRLQDMITKSLSPHEAQQLGQQMQRVLKEKREAEEQANDQKRLAEKYMKQVERWTMEQENWKLTEAKYKSDIQHLQKILEHADDLKVDVVKLKADLSRKQTEVDSLTEQLQHIQQRSQACHLEKEKLERKLTFATLPDELQSIQQRLSDCHNKFTKLDTEYNKVSVQAMKLEKQIQLKNEQFDQVMRTWKQLAQETNQPLPLEPPLSRSIKPSFAPSPDFIRKQPGPSSRTQQQQQQQQSMLQKKNLNNRS